MVIVAVLKKISKIVMGFLVLDFVISKFVGSDYRK